MNNKQLCLLMHLRWLLCYGDFLHLQWMNIQIFLCQHQQNKATELELQFCRGPGHNSMDQGLLLNFSFGDMNEAMQWIGQNETKMRHSSIRHQGHRRSLCSEIIREIYLQQPFISRPNKRSGSVDVTKVWSLLHWSTNIMWLMADKELESCCCSAQAALWGNFMAVFISGFFW